MAQTRWNWWFLKSTFVVYRKDQRFDCCCCQMHILLDDPKQYAFNAMFRYTALHSSGSRPLSTDTFSLPRGHIPHFKEIIWRLFQWPRFRLQNVAIIVIGVLYIQFIAPFLVLPLMKMVTLFALRKIIKGRLPSRNKILFMEKAWKNFHARNRHGLSGLQATKPRQQPAGMTVWSAKPSGSWRGCNLQHH